MKCRTIGIPLAVLALVPGTLFPNVRADTPPPLGPPQASSEPNGWFDLALFRRAMEQYGDAAIEQSGGSIRWAAGGNPNECGYDCVQPAMVRWTRRPDRPNERFVQVDGRLSFEVDIPVLPGRQVDVDVRLRAFCAGWATGSGKLKIFVQSSMPWVSEDHSWVEGALDFLTPGDLSGAIAAGIAENLPSSSESNALEFPGFCESIGHESNFSGGGDWTLDRIVWDRRTPSPLPVPMGRLVIEFQSVERFEVPEWAEKPNKEVSFIFYANGRPVQFPAAGYETTLHANSVLKLSDTSISVPRPASDGELQIIVSDSYGAGRWVSYDNGSSFGLGSHKLRTTRTALRPVDAVPSGVPGGTKKPVPTGISEFEISYRIRLGGIVAPPP